MPSLKTLSETCKPRAEVLTGELRDEMFAANLSKIVAREAHPVYQDPDQFFANTYPTARVQSFLREVLARLSGTDATASACFRLDTPFGGGKTHTLIALYHLATAAVAPRNLQRLGIGSDILPKDVRVATIVGDNLDPANGVERNGLRIHHLWGELAFQLGGREGYALVQRSDEQGQAPGPQFLDKLIADAPTLILVDEPAVYMRKMGPAANQLPAFLKALTEWVAAAPRAVLVLTLAWSADAGRPTGDAFGRETEALESAFREVQAVVSRPIRVVTPAERQDIEPILRQRLFQQVDMSAAEAVADAYWQMLQQASQRGTPLPAPVVQASYREALRVAYPFHPSLVEVLDGKLATVPNFQRTRGALRLMARVIRRCWEQGEARSLLLLHPFTLDFGDPDLIDELTGRLDRPAFRSVVAYDIARSDGQAHAQVLDRQRFAGHPPYTRRVATTIFLHSLPEPPARGIDLDELLAATLTPDSDPAHLEKAIEYLRDEAWHLDSERDRYTFRTEPSLNKIVLDEMDAIPLHDAREEVKRRIQLLWKDAGLAVERFPNEPADLADQPKGRLVILHWDTASFRAQKAATPPQVEEFWQYAGVQRDYRRFRNTLFFLVADADRTQRMVDQARRWLALDGLLRDTRKLDEYKLGPEHRQRLREWHKDADLQVRLAITRAYCHLFYPVGDTDSPYKPFAHHTLLVEDQGAAAANQTERVLNILRELQRVRSADDAPIHPALVRQQAFNHDEGSVSLRAFLERFAERVRLPLLLEPTYLKEIARLGIKDKVWLYYDVDANLAYDHEGLAALTDIVIDERHELMLPEEARRRGVPVYRKEPPPQPPGVGARPPEGETLPPPPPPAITEVTAEGEPGKALADLAAKAKDAGWHALHTLTVHWQADGKDVPARLAAILTILGQVPEARATLDLDLACEWSDGTSCQTSFRGLAEHFKALAATAGNLAGQATDAHASVGLALEFPDGLPVDGPAYRDLRDVLAGVAGLGRTHVIATRAERTTA